MNKRYMVSQRLQAISILILIPFICHSQIGFTEVTKPKPAIKNEIKFDSTKNWLGSENVKSYKGQTLFVLPVSDGLEKYGYRHFEKGAVPKDSYGKVEYEELANKYFVVDSAILFIEKYSIYRKFLFYLTEKDGSEKYLYYYDPESEYGFPFLVVSHFNYMKDNYVGKRYVISSNYLSSHDLVTGDTLIFPSESKMSWTVSDITIVNNDLRNLCVVVKSGKMTSYVAASTFEYGLQGSKGIRRVFEKTEWDRLVKTYGLSMMQSVMDVKIKIGMPKKLLIMSWGKPDHVNSASYGDQYVYEDQYVYLKNGKITSWN